MRAWLVAVSCTLALAGHAETVGPVPATPEAALRALEDAYRARDLEAAVQLKGFDMEAQMMLAKINPEFASDPELVAEAAETLEVVYRAEIKKQGFPDFRGVSCKVTDKRERSEDRVVVTQECVGPGGAKNTQRILVGRSKGGWRVLIPVE